MDRVNEQLETADVPHFFHLRNHHLQHLEYASELNITGACVEEVPEQHHEFVEEIAEKCFDVTVLQCVFGYVNKAMMFTQIAIIFCTSVESPDCLMTSIAQNALTD